MYTSICTHRCTLPSAHIGVHFHLHTSLIRLLLPLFLILFLVTLLCIKYRLKHIFYDHFHGLVIYFHLYLKTISFIYRDETNYHPLRSYPLLPDFTTQITNYQVDGSFHYIFYMFDEDYFISC